jgi:hypothetical protein
VIPKLTEKVHGGLITPNHCRLAVPGRYRRFLMKSDTAKLMAGLIDAISYLRLHLVP